MEITSGCVTAFSASIKRFSSPIGILFQSNCEYSVKLRRKARLRTTSFNNCLLKKHTHTIKYFYFFKILLLSFVILIILIVIIYLYLRYCC